CRGDRAGRGAGGRGGGERPEVARGGWAWSSARGTDPGSCSCARTWPRRWRPAPPVPGPSPGRTPPRTTPNYRAWRWGAGSARRVSLATGSRPPSPLRGNCRRLRRSHPAGGEDALGRGSHVASVRTAYLEQFARSEREAEQGQRVLGDVQIQRHIHRPDEFHLGHHEPGAVGGKVEALAVVALHTEHVVPGV